MGVGYWRRRPDGFFSSCPPSTSYTYLLRFLLEAARLPGYCDEVYTNLYYRLRLLLEHVLVRLAHTERVRAQDVEEAKARS